MKILEKTISAQGREILLKGGESAKNILVIGVFHGDEPQGKFLIENYLQYNDSNLLFIPCLNPDGMALGVRTNFHGVDLNRNFPTKNWELTEKNEFYGGEKPSSEIETQFLVKIIEKYNPKLILTLHAPFKVVNYDGHAREISEKISEIIKYPVEASIGYPTPGSFGTYAGVERNIKTVTLELDEECPVEDLIEPVNKIFKLLENC